MVLLDEHGLLLCDEDHQPGEQLRQALIQQGVACTYADEHTLYRHTGSGGIFIAVLTLPKFHTINLTAKELTMFRMVHRVATETFTIRDIGCQLARVYMDDCSFTVPLEVLSA